LLLTPASEWPAYFLTLLPINLFFAGGGTVVGAGYFVANAGEALVGALIVRRFASGPRTTLDGLRVCVAFVTGAVVLGPILGASIGAFAVMARTPGVEYLDAWRVWFLGDAGGNLILAPAVLAVANLRRVGRPVSAARLSEAGVIVFGIVVAGLAALGVVSSPTLGAADLSVLYVPIPLLVWAGLRFGPAGAASGNLLLAGLAVAGAVQSRGPFAHADNPLAVLVMQEFLIVAGATAMTLAGASEDRRRTLAALKLSETKFERVFHESPDAITLSHLLTGRLIEVNAGFERIVQINRQEAIGRTTKELGIWESPDQRDAIVRAMQGGHCQNVLVRLRPRRGPTRTVLFSATPLDLDGVPCMVAVTRDITELKQIEAALHDSETRYRSLLDTATDVVVTTDLTGRIETANMAFETQTGWTRNDWFGEPVMQFLDPADVERAATLLKDLAMGAVPEMREWRVRTRSGEWRLGEVKASVFERSGVPAGILLIARDVTDRRRAEAERARLEEQVAQGRKLEAIGQLAGGIAHDFNNILQAILGFAHLAEEEMVPGSVASEHLGKVIQAGGRAQTLTQQLLTFSRREKVTPKLLDALAVLGEFNQILRRVLPANITLSLAGDAGVPRVLADRGHLEQVLMNLCVNARDAMPEGGTITVRVGRVQVDDAFVATHAGARAGDFVTIGVSDSGSGIAPDVLPHIFEPFYTTKEVGQGTGLGLATIYGIVQSCDGFIDVSSAIGRGTTFLLYFPAHVEPGAADAVAANAPAAALGRGELILVAEDDVLARQLAVSQLTRAGYRVLAAGDGAEALALFEANASDIQLVFLDVMMPRGDGRAVRRAIAVRRPDVAVLFATGYVDRERLGGPFDDITDPILDKPYAPATLLAKVRTLLDAAVRAR